MVIGTFQKKRQFNVVPGTRYNSPLCSGLSAESASEYGLLPF